MARYTVGTATDLRGIKVTGTAAWMAMELIVHLIAHNQRHTLMMVSSTVHALTSNTVVLCALLSSARNRDSILLMDKELRPTHCAAIGGDLRSSEAAQVAGRPNAQTTKRSNVFLRY